MHEWCGIGWEHLAITTKGPIVCLGVPGQIVELIDGDTHLAMADVSGVKQRINVGIVELDGVKVDDWVLIHVGFAMAIIDEEEAASTLEFLATMGQVWDDQIGAVMESSVE